MAEPFLVFIYFRENVFFHVSQAVRNWPFSWLEVDNHDLAHEPVPLVVAPALGRSQLQEPFAVVRSREAVGDRLVEAALLHDLLVASI